MLMELQKPRQLCRCSGNKEHRSAPAALCPSPIPPALQTTLGKRTHLGQRYRSKQRSNTSLINELYIGTCGQHRITVERRGEQRGPRQSMHECNVDAHQHKAALPQASRLLPADAMRDAHAAFIACRVWGVGGCASVHRFSHH